MSTDAISYSPEARFIRVEMRNSLYRSQTESGRDAAADAKTVIGCFDLADLVVQGLAVFDSINSLDHDWRLLVYEKHLAYSEAFEKRIGRLYRTWSETSLQVLSLFDSLANDYQTEGFDTQPIERLRSACREAAGILTDEESFFSHQKLVELRDAAIEDHRSGAAFEVG